jgi:hypothetical protein
VIALSLARLGDAIGNSLLFVVISLYVARMPAPWFPSSETVRVGILISAYGVFSRTSRADRGSAVNLARDLGEDRASLTPACMAEENDSRPQSPPGPCERYRLNGIG